VPSPENNPDDAASLGDLRARIDRLDARLVELLAERMAVVDRIAAAKADRAIIDPLRERSIFQRVRTRARDLHLDPELAERVVGQVISGSRERQHHRRWQKDAALLVSPAGAAAYPVIVNPGALSSLAGMLPARCTRVVLIADDTVAALHGASVRAALEPVPVLEIRFPAGEPHKTRARKERIEDAMLAAHVDRHAVVVGLGGGISTDLAGFVAATFERGLPWLAVPTSLLGAVDASVGGKVGVNTPAGKNLIGAFHHPRAVVTDVDLLATLPDPEWANGRAEMLKHGVVADEAAVEELCANAARLREPEVLTRAIRRSVAVKATIVSQDPLESDRRRVLNFGHTAGHAIEAASHFEVPHGLAVAIGMAVEANIAVASGLLASSERDRIVAALDRLQLPTRVPDSLSTDEIIACARADKKGRDGVPRYALPERVGAMAVGSEGHGHPVPEEVVRAALEQACGA
jgi:3-dehydroquinate synthase